MPNASPQPAAPIRACVHDGALRRVTRFFSSTPGDIFSELLQNARRAGATCVGVDTKGLPEGEGGGIRVTVTDDGTGVGDAAVLLSFGETGWDETVARNEDAAGMGLASLARRGCRVSSRRAMSRGVPAPGWRIALSPAHFLGEENAIPLPDNGAPYPNGTAVSFKGNETLDAIEGALTRAALHYPLAVTFNGETVDRRAFLDGTVHAEPWRGIMFGAFKNGCRGYNDPDLNFHGLTLPVRLPHIVTLDSGTWTVRADIGTCPELELVLPARKEAVETPFLEEMREAARLAIYRAVAHADPAPRLAYEDWKRAGDAGIHLPVPPAELHPWIPGTADVDYWREAPPFAPVGADALVMAFDPDPHDAQAFYRAAKKAGIASRLFEADKRLEGYGWYDALSRVRDIRTGIEAGGITHPLDALRTAGNGTDGAIGNGGIADSFARPDAIHMQVDIVRADGTPESIAVPADLALMGEAYGWLQDVRPLVTSDSDLAPEELARLLNAGFFSPSDDADADSWETQHTRFEEEALHMALKLLCSDDEARRQSIANAVWREILWLMPRGREVGITVRNRKVSVELGPVAAEAAQ